MVEVLRRGKWVETKSIPQSLGSVWRSKEYVHGPRIRQPEQFSKLYVFSIKRARDRHIPLENKPKNAIKAKIGTLKSSGRLRVQSYLTRVRSHKRLGRLVKSHYRILSQGSPKFTAMVNDMVKRDREIREFEPPVNVREVDRLLIDELLGVAKSRTVSFPKRKDALIGDPVKGFDIFVDKSAPWPEFAFLHELGHVDDQIKKGIGITDEETAEEFAIRKVAELNLPIPYSEKELAIRNQELLNKRSSESGRKPVFGLERRAIDRARKLEELWKTRSA